MVCMDLRGSLCLYAHWKECMWVWCFSISMDISTNIPMDMPTLFLLFPHEKILNGLSYKVKKLFGTTYNKLWMNLTMHVCVERQHMCQVKDETKSTFVMKVNIEAL